MRRLQLISHAMLGGVHHAFRLADTVARSVDRRMPEAGGLAGWLDQDRAQLGLPDGEDFATGNSRSTALPAPAWRRLRSAITRGMRTAPDQDTSPIERWLTLLADHLGFDAAERNILRLALLYRLDERVEHLVDFISTARGGPAHLQADIPLLALFSAAEPGAIEHALQPEGRLLASGLLRVHDDGIFEPIDKLVSLIRSGSLPKADPFGQLLGPAAIDTLPWDAFAHLGQHARVAADLLAAAVARREPGVNILLYGPPGTGKTTFAAALAAHIGARLRPVMEQDSMGGEPNRQERLSGLRLAQRMAPPGETVLLFDEAEDIFVRPMRNDDGPSSTPRVFMHRLLENTPVPIIWTANDIRALGPAVLRRMTMCLELKVPGIAVRARLWRSSAEAEGIALDVSDADRLARLIPAAPAVAATALRATRLAGGDAGTALLIVEGIARAVAGGPVAAAALQSHELYDPALINADADLVALADQLARPDAPKAVSLLLSGPPGTGKSAWVRHLAGRMGLEVIQKRASDLLGPFVGQTESNIAAAFAEALETGSFLVFDEADSLLGDRAGAQRSWEVSQVNEMLTWMEQHPLPFACTTNLVDRLDPASLRRFLFKVRFTWMAPTQARSAFGRFFKMAPLPALDALRTLTPADFALVSRRAEFVGQSNDPRALLQFLSAECEGRLGSVARIGFNSD